MLDNIIVGVDGQDGGRDAIALAVRLAPLTAGRIVLVHAYPNDPRPFRGSNLDYDRVVREDAEALLVSERERAGIDAEIAAYPATSAAHALHVMARPGANDVIVVGSSRRGAIGRVLAGDDVRATLNSAPCAVVVAASGGRDGGRPITRIGVGFDGSTESGRALEAAAALARAGAGALEVIDVVTEPRAPAYGWPVAFDWDEVFAEARHEAAVEVDRATGDLDVPVRKVIRRGIVGRELVELSAGLDLLVVGSRGFGPLRRVINGSVSDELVHHAGCPVLVVPRASDEEIAEPPAAVATSVEA